MYMYMYKYMYIHALCDMQHQKAQVVHTKIRSKRIGIWPGLCQGLAGGAVHLGPHTHVMAGPPANCHSDSSSYKASVW